MSKPMLLMFGVAASMVVGGCFFPWGSPETPKNQPPVGETVLAPVNGETQQPVQAPPPPDYNRPIYPPIIGGGGDDDADSIGDSMGDSIGDSLGDSLGGKYRKAIKIGK